MGGLFIMMLQWVFCTGVGISTNYIPTMSEGVMYGAAMCVR